MKTLTVKREGTSTEFSYEIVWDGSYERLAGCVENLKLPAKKACIVTDRKGGSADSLSQHRQGPRTPSGGDGFRTVSGRGKKCTVPAV